ncbi:MAG: hypothetical protein AAF402_06165 [Pseudomonadota bacterium]
MNTPAHVVFSLALMGRRNARTYPIAITAGALLPDLAMFGFYAWQRFQGVSESAIWGEKYYLSGWQSFFDTFNSLPLIAIGLVFTVWRGWKFATMLLISMAVHCLIDLPVHHDDAHRHFFPFSEYRFFSPVSYWDPQHFGNYVLTVEIVLTLILGGYLWVSSRATANAPQANALRLILVLALAAYAFFMAFAWLTWSAL